MDIIIQSVLCLWKVIVKTFWSIIIIELNFGSMEIEN